MKKTFFSFIAIISFLLPCFTAFGEPTNPADTVETPAEGLTLAADAAILMDAATGEVLYEKDIHKKEYPASITKLMTILLALEKGSLTDTLTFSHDAIYSIERGSAHIAIQEGETLTLEQVLRAIILRSANEASNGIAEYVDGSMEAFARHMTNRAKELGCQGTNFVNANGLFDENHYTTAYDMALIAKELLTHKEYRAIMSETYYEIPPTNKQTETRYLHGQHQMLNKNSLYYYEYAIGGKTGFTSEALNTLVTYAKKDHTELIAVVFKCKGAEHYTDTAALFDYGFSHYETVKLLSAADYTKTVQVTETYKKKTTTLDTVSVAPAGDVYHTLPIGADISALKVSVDCPESIEAPVAEGQSIGKITLALNGKTLQTVDMKAAKAVSATSDEARAAAKQAGRKALFKK
ncbi:MAG: D-alanyl-D-alanine carboxypeptidase, partial [Anaerotignum sp.]|nr:D-alanyl-D-alanine carboxypeptidase [Anaerotignum sp.]